MARDKTVMKLKFLYGSPLSKFKETQRHPPPFLGRNQQKQRGLWGFKGKRGLFL